MKAKFLGRTKKDYMKNQSTGEMGTEHNVQVLMPEGVKILRVQEPVYDSLSGVSQGDEVQIVFGLQDGRFGGHYPVVAAVQPAR